MATTRAGGGCFEFVLTEYERVRFDTLYVERMKRNLSLPPTANADDLVDAMRQHHADAILALDDNARACAIASIAGERADAAAAKVAAIARDMIAARGELTEGMN